MALPMNKKEFENWEKTRAQGSNKYALKTSFIATIFSFVLYFVVNGYLNLSHIDQYIAYNVGQAHTHALTLVIVFVVMFVPSKVLFHINEKRYQATINKNNK